MKFTTITWPTLLKAASLGQDQTWTFLQENGAFDPGFEPRGRCGQRYSHAKSLSSMREKMICNDISVMSSVDSENDASPLKIARLTRGSMQRTDPSKMCIFVPKK